MIESHKSKKVAFSLQLQLGPASLDIFWSLNIHEKEDDEKVVVKPLKTTVVSQTNASLPDNICCT